MRVLREGYLYPLFATCGVATTQVLQQISTTCNRFRMSLLDSCCENNYTLDHDYPIIFAQHDVIPVADTVTVVMGKFASIKPILRLDVAFASNARALHHSDLVGSDVALGSNLTQSPNLSGELDLEGG